MHLHRSPTQALGLRFNRSRWHIAQHFLRGKDDLGLDHYEGRSWQGFPHQLAPARSPIGSSASAITVEKNFRPDVGDRAPRDSSMAGEIDRLPHLRRSEA